MHTWCTLGAHLVHTWCTLGAHLVHTWCTLGAHLVNSYPGAHLVHTWCTPGEQLTLLSLSPHLSLYPFYLYLHIYHSIYPISLSILALCSHSCSPCVHQVCTRCSLFGCAPGDHCSPGVHQVCTRCALGCAPGVHQVCRATLPNCFITLTIIIFFSGKGTLEGIA